MKFKAILFILIFSGNLKTFSKDLSLFVGTVNTPLTSNKLLINNLDSIIFDLANATLTPTYIDLPIYIKSNDVIFSFDYAMTFNMSKLTFSTTIDLLPSDPTFGSFAHFNPTDLFLRNTSSSQQSIPSIGNVYLTKIRFLLSAACVPISSSDFTNILTILNGTQCSSRVTSLNFAQFIPNANFKTGPTCLNTLTLFSDTSTLIRGTIDFWSWSFSNGQSSSLQNNIITYTTAGTASATLIVKASTGCKDTVVKSLTISPPPTSSFTYSFNCIKDSVLFNNTSTVPSGTIISSLWYFGDLSGTSTLKNPSHHYASSGFYKVKLSSTSNSLCVSTTNITISLRPSDINKDGITDVNDFLIFVPAWLSPCNL